MPSSNPRDPGKQSWRGIERRVKSVEDSVNQPNMIDNGDFWVQGWRPHAPTSTSTTINDSTTSVEVHNDDYGTVPPVDRWHIISDGNDVVDIEVQRAPLGATATDLKSDQRSCIVLTTATTAKKFGICQNIASERISQCIQPTDKKNVSLSFDAMYANDGTGTLAGIRAAIIEWSGTIDTCTATPISAWGADDANPTYVASNSIANSEADLSPVLADESWQRYSVENVAITASTTKNLRILIWINDPDGTATGDKLYISNVKLEYGATATAYTQKSIAEEQHECARHYQLIGANSDWANPSGDSDLSYCGMGTAYTTNDASIVCPLNPPMYNNPTRFVYAPVGVFELLAVSASTYYTATTVAAVAGHTTRNALLVDVAVAATPLASNDTLQLVCGTTADGNSNYLDGIHVRSNL